MFKAPQKKRLYGIIAIISGVSLAASLAMYALGQNIDLYLTPGQLYSHPPPEGRLFRIGGVVEKGSFKREQGGLTVHFILTDYTHIIPVTYTGVLPTLFREGQGVVVEGKLNSGGHFIADQVLAKHDEKYKPPSIQG